VTRRAKTRLWVRYVLRRHEITGRRVRRPRWRTITSPHGRPLYSLGAWNDELQMFVGWEWPG
jgi:hypothetical protein